MENTPSTSKVNSSGFDDDVFDDSSFLAKFQESTFRKNTSNCTNDSINNSKFNVSALCCDEEIPGYDKLAGRTWIYPTNYPVRNYQFNIINAALVKNTLVSLPTGLGKTFIAAVIMYNFYRWYPTGKIIFTAPTRPLVAQQIDACYNIVAIPSSDTIEMTGHMQTNTRKTHWISKRVFFATPQVIHNDIQSGICPADKIRCLVIDEAHRARGNYAYCQIVSTLTDMGHNVYRVLALSATPGSKVEDVVNVVKNLHITHLELRTENCIDVAPYRHSRKINTVVIQLGPELSHLRNQYVEILDSYARRLKQLNILPNNVGNLSKGRIVMLYKEFQTRERGARHPQHNLIMKDFTILIALYHGLELLVKHGTRVFLNFFDEHPEKSWIQADYLLMALLERLRDDLGTNPLALDRSVLPDGTVPEIPDNLVYGHPKFDKLKEIMLQHFQQAQEKKQDTRAIVFCEYRESVNLVHCLLLQCRPLIKAQMFVGQGASGKEGKASISQKQQLRVMSRFREGLSNVLVATCVAEEGLDVGSVDLIVCFDISNRSPIRLVQRCGRTGRERGGHVQILVTEGREHQTLMDCIRQTEGLNKKILQSKDVQNNLYKLNPRMMPHDFTPTCQKMYITVNKQDTPEAKPGKKKRGQKDLRTMLLGKTGSSSSNSSLQESCTNPHITEEEFQQMFPSGFQATSLLPRMKEYLAMNKETFQTSMQSTTESPAKLSKWLEWQRSLQNTVNIGHTRDSGILSELLQYCDNKKMDGPANTQNPSFATQDTRPPIIEPIIPEPKIVKKKQKSTVAKSPNKNNGDIRALFSTATKSTKNYTKLINNLGVPNDGTITTSLIDLFVDLSIESTNISKPCYICQNICKCEALKSLKDMNKKSKTNLSFLTHMILPSVNLIEAIDKESLLDYNKNYVIETQVNFKKNERANFDLEIEFGSLEEVNNESVTVAAINSANNDKNNDNVSINDKIIKNNANNFEIGNIDEIFIESSPEEAIHKELEDKNNDSNPKEALEFFGLDSIDDIFADSDNSIKNTPENQIINIDNKTIEVSRAPSPSILTGSVKRNSSTSPILCTQRKHLLSTKKKNIASSTPIFKSRLNFDKDNSINKLNSKNKDDNSSIKTTQHSKANNLSTQSNNKSLFTITQLVEMINKTGNSTGVGNSSANKNKTEDFDKDLFDDDNEIITSPVLLTQANKKETTFKIPSNIANRSKIELEKEFLPSNIENNSIIELDNTERCVSPVLLTQTHKKKNKSLEIRKNDSLIILPSDSDSDDTVIYDLDNDIRKTSEKNKSNDNFNDKNKSKDDFGDKNKSNDNFEDSLFIRSPLKNKRKLDDDNASTYFKKQKTEPGKSIQEKIISALSLNRRIPKTTENFSADFVISQKENLTPSVSENLTPNVSISKDLSQTSSSKIDLLQKFRRDKKKMAATPQKIDFGPKKRLDFRNKHTFDDDSDDDFDFNDKKRNIKSVEVKQSFVNHKVRKKKKPKDNSLLDLEAELSGSGSGDELSDESVGSIIDFICDEPDESRADIQAVYLESVKDRCKGTFKIPQLPSRFNKEEVFSQYVDDNDAYEMDSFCVDSHVGLTQVHDISELELAERQLEIRKKSRRKRVIQDTTFSPPTTDVIVHSDNDSPVVRRKNKRRISSDSE